MATVRTDTLPSSVSAALGKHENQVNHSNNNNNNHTSIIMNKNLIYSHDPSETTNGSGSNSQQSSLPQFKNRTTQVWSSASASSVDNKRVWIRPVPSIVAPPSTSTRVVDRAPVYHFLKTVSYHAERYQRIHDSSDLIQRNVELYLSDALTVHDNLHLYIINELKSAVQETIDQLSSNQLHEKQPVSIDLLLVRFPVAIYQNLNLLRAVWHELEESVKSLNLLHNVHQPQEKPMVKRIGLYNIHPSQLQSVLKVATTVRPSAVGLSWEFVTSQKSSVISAMQELCTQNEVQLLTSSNLKESLSFAGENMRWLSHYSVIQPDTTLLLRSGLLFTQK